MSMLKQIMNPRESITYKHVNEIAARYNAAAYPKIRMADILLIERSGIPNDLFTFALTAHFDVTVVTKEWQPLFAVEFDGEHHVRSPEQRERDRKKDALCKRFGFPFLRVTTEYLTNHSRRMNLLSWFIETWFAADGFNCAQEHGDLPYDEPFIPINVVNISGHQGMFPLWLSRDAQSNILTLFQQTVIPSSLIWHDDVHSEYHGLAWVHIDSTKAVMAKTDMKAQDFPVPMVDLVDDLTVIQLYDALTETLSGDRPAVSPDTVAQLISEMKSRYGLIHSGGGVIGRWL